MYLSLLMLTIVGALFLLIAGITYWLRKHLIQTQLTGLKNFKHCQICGAHQQVKAKRCAVCGQWL